MLDWSLKGPVFKPLRGQVVFFFQFFPANFQCLALCKRHALCWEVFLASFGRIWHLYHSCITFQSFLSQQQILLLSNWFYYGEPANLRPVDPIIKIFIPTFGTVNLFLAPEDLIIRHSLHAQFAFEAHYH